MNLDMRDAPMKGLKRKIAALLNKIPIDFGGGCSLQKAYLMAWLIGRYELRSSLDIGVYRGRSIFPQAIAHKLSTGGIVYGVDPWDAEEARQKDSAHLKEAIDAFTGSIDYEGIYRSVCKLRNELRLEDNCLLIKQTSAKAIEYFRAEGIEFDLIHIDGNHDTDRVMSDVRNYMPCLRKNGFIVMDDVSWTSVKPAYKTLAAKMAIVYQRANQSPDDFAILWDNSSRFEVLKLRAMLALLIWVMISKPSLAYRKLLRLVHSTFIEISTWRSTAS